MGGGGRAWAVRSALPSTRSSGQSPSVSPSRDAATVVDGNFGGRGRAGRVLDVVVDSPSLAAGGEAAFAAAGRASSRSSSSSSSSSALLTRSAFSPSHSRGAKIGASGSHRRHLRRRRYPASSATAVVWTTSAAIAASAAVPTAAASSTPAAATAAAASTATAREASRSASSLEGTTAGTGNSRFSKQRVVAAASPPDGGAAVAASRTKAGAAAEPKPKPLWRRQSEGGPATTKTTTITTRADADADAEADADAAAASNAGATGAWEFLRSFFGTSRRAELLQDVVKVLVWSFFAERLLQSALVGWGQSGRVGAVEQLGGTLIEADPSDIRYQETQAMLKGVRAGRDTLHLNVARASPEMFTKVDCTEIQPSSAVEREHPERRRKGEDEGDAEHRHEMAGGSTGDRMLFFDYAAPAFAHLRGVYGMSASEYRGSFREGSKMIALASNSKSAQSFMFSEDGKYMLKTASESELDSMLRLLPRYAEHVARRQGSLITRFYGIHRVSNPSTGRSTVFVSSSNVFSTEKRLHERYDLKGSVVGRRTLPAKSTAVAKPTTMLKDLDLSESSADGKKIRLAAGCKKRLMAELRADSDFLAGLGLMDYSLLVGIHHPNKVSPSKVRSKVLAFPLALLSAASKPVWATGCYVLGLLPGGARRGGRRPQVGVYPGREPGVVYYMGIIDVLQRYNLKKILERGAKGVVYNRHELSAVPPAEYRDRFIDFIDRSTE